MARIAPLTFIEYQMGPVVICPRDEALVQLLRGTGDILPLDSEADFTVAQGFTSTIGPVYYLVGAIKDWAVGRGLSEEFSVDYLLSFFEALGHKARWEKARGLPILWEEMTVGGLNETVIREVEHRGGYRAWGEALDVVLERLNQQFEEQ